MPDYQAELSAWGAAANAEIADLEADKEALAYQLVAAQSDDTADDAKILELETALLTKNGEIEFYLDQADDLNAKIIEQQALINRKNTRIAALRAKLAACEGTVTPEPSAYPAALGYCPDNNTSAEVARLGQWSGGRVRRTYKPPGTFPNTPTFVSDPAAGLRTASTMKGPGSTMKDRMEQALSNTDRASWKSYVGKSAKNSILGAEHEPEDDAPGGPLYREFQRWFSTLVREVNAEDGGSRLVAGNLMSITDSQSKILNWFPGDGYWDIVGFDGYNWPNRTPGSTTIPRWVEFEEIFRPDHDAARSLGLDFAIFEYGCRKADLYYQCNNENLPSEEFTQKQIDWHRKAWPVIQELKPVVATYFHHDWWLMPEAGHRAMGGQ